VLSMDRSGQDIYLGKAESASSPRVKKSSLECTC
jgi:hypothetical protein